MPPNNHAILSASSSYRWLHCPPSARLESNFASTESQAAAEGTAAHALAEHKLRRALKRRSKRPVSDYDTDDMEQYTDDYCDFCMEQYEQEKQNCPDTKIATEIKLDLSAYIPHGFGTCDCLIVSDKQLHIIDFKYGQGIVVDATNNSQLKLYALGALALYGNLYDCTEVALTIFQPRRDNIGTWTIPAADLLTWAEADLKPMAQQAYAGEGNYCSGDWCTFCRAATKCRTRAEAKLKLANYEFALPPLLTDDEIEHILGMLDDLTQWANALKTYALDAAVAHGKVWQGWKVVAGRSNRRYTNEANVAEAAKTAGYADIYKKKLITITEMEKLMGKKNFTTILGALVDKPPGKPTLVPLTDKRPALNITDVNHEFTEVTENEPYQ